MFGYFTFKILSIQDWKSYYSICDKITDLKTAAIHTIYANLYTWLFLTPAIFILNDFIIYGGRDEISLITI